MTNDSHMRGAVLHADALLRLLDFQVQVNLRAEAAGRRKTPLCIWGRHGIGKTEIVREYARARDCEFAYVAPAQFEEMGDLLGMPAVEETGGAPVTVFRPPNWVPVAPGPGILLLDDVNRADDRILRGLMQLLQDYRLVSWALPPRWQIVLTANPEDSEYSVTRMDDALLTRLLHVTLEFDAASWAGWARRRQIDERGIQFVLTFPETVTGHRTTPRSLVQFFTSLEGIDDLEGDWELVRTLAEACLDAETVAAFTTFVQQRLHRLPGPAAILSADAFSREVAAPLRELICGDVLRVDILAGLCRRLVNELKNRQGACTGKELENLKAFLELDFLPNELRLGLMQELVDLGTASLERLMADPRLGRLFLDQD